MNKAEERAMEKYPPHSILIVPARGGGYYADSHLREGFIEGYHQAEKDNELTWQDIKLIHNINFEESRNVALKKGGEISEQEFYQEVLKRFKERKRESR